MYKKLEGLVLSAGDSRRKSTKPEASKTSWLPEKRVGTHFAEGMVENVHLKKPRTLGRLFVSVLGHSFVVALLILAPLLYTVIESVIDQQGHVTQMKVVSGSPLLVESAMQAVAQWRYQPTLLNGEPVAVDMLVTVHFDLGGQPS